MIIATLKITKVNLVDFSRRGGPPSKIKSLSIPDVFLNMSSARECASLVDNVEICDLIEGKMVPCRKRSEEEISKLVMYSPKIMMEGKEVFVRDENSGRKLSYSQWDGNKLKAKKEDYALGMSTALRYLDKKSSYYYYDLLRSDQIGQYRALKMMVRIYLVNELNKLKAENPISS
ncbi:hypothetical protein KY308_04030 [Candidatus Woesearchaeota archaeon]|nr:hypothetical protein [Candidatus Woesearchaeota archaeon]